jgi:FAD:protein FMN transferase
MKKICILSFLGLLLLAGCRTAPRPETLARFEFAEPHMGTLWRITLYAPDGAAATNAVRAAFARVKALDLMMTDYDPESELMRLSKSPRGVPVPVSKDLLYILQRSQETARLSDGAFDVTVGPIVQLWRRARRQHELPAKDRLAAARQSIGSAKLKLNAREQTATLLADKMRLDLGGIAKGFGADEALHVLRDHGLRRALVAASGDLAIGDPPPGKTGWRIGIGLPNRAATNLAVLLLLHNAGVSTSGDTEQFVEIEGLRYSHIVDPRSGLALTNRLQATIIAPCTTRSDALATTVCVLGPRQGMELIDSLRGTAAFLIAEGAGTNLVTLKSRRFSALEKRQPRAAQ